MEDSKRTERAVDSILNRVNIDPSKTTAFTLHMNPIRTLTEKQDQANNVTFLTNKMRAVSMIPPRVLEVLELLVSGNANWPLTLWGTPGTGKTCAALATLDRVAVDQRKVWRSRAIRGRAYFTMTDYCTRVLDAKFHRGSESHDSLMEKIECAALIVIDEIDRVSNVSDTRHEELTNVLDRREGMPLIIISNSSPDTLGQMYGDRVPSRLAKGVIMEVVGKDRRIHK